MLNAELQKPDQKIYLQISAGQGPRECAWVVAQVTRKVLEEASQQQVCATVLETRAFDKHLRGLNDVETDAFSSTLVCLTGVGAQAYVAQWQGVVKWQGESPFRIGHKRINWFVGVQCVERNSSVAVSLSQLEKEVHFVATRSGGPGGQHVNKTSSAVWATHLPTGLKLRVESDRSQHRNRRIALERLQLQLSASVQKTAQQQVATNRLEHYQIQRGNPVKVFCGADFLEKR